MTITYSNGTRSKEVEILSSLGCGYFAIASDAGAMVVNVEKQWVGMVIGRPGLNGWYMKLVRELFEDIEETELVGYYCN